MPLTRPKSPSSSGSKRWSERGEYLNDIHFLRAILKNNKRRKGHFDDQMKKIQMIEQLKRNPKNVRFDKLCAVAEAFGFHFRGVKGSHRIYVREGVREILNFQNVDGKAKPYQVRQFINIIEKYSLIEEDADV